MTDTPTTAYRAVVDGTPRTLFNADRAERLSDEGHAVTARVVSA